MLGRAGRPQYDSFGEGIIITGAVIIDQCALLVQLRGLLVLGLSPQRERSVWRKRRLRHLIV